MFLTNSFFFVITKNLKWEVLTENLALFKRSVRDKDENFEGAHKKQINRGELPKRRALTMCRFKTGFAKKMWRGGGDILMHTMRYNRKPKKYEGIFGFYIDRNFLCNQ